MAARLSALRAGRTLPPGFFFKIPINSDKYRKEIFLPKSQLRKFNNIFHFEN
jgi:hypothetical protein